MFPQKHFLSFRNLINEDKFVSLKIGGNNLFSSQTSLKKKAKGLAQNFENNFLYNNLLKMI